MRCYCDVLKDTNGLKVIVSRHARENLSHLNKNLFSTYRVFKLHAL